MTNNQTITDLNPHKRTIFVTKNNSIKKYTLNFPKLLFYTNINNNNTYLCTRAINENNQICYTPLSNITVNGSICMPHYNENKDFIKEFFYSAFTLEDLGSIRPYLIPGEQIRMLRCIGIEKFYQYWQNTGNIKLIPVQQQYYSNIDKKFQNHLESTINTNI